MIFDCTSETGKFTSHNCFERNFMVFSFTQMDRNRRDLGFELLVFEHRLQF